MEVLDTYRADQRPAALENLPEHHWATLSTPANQAGLNTLIDRDVDNSSLPTLAVIIGYAVANGLAETLSVVRTQRETKSLIDEWIAAPTWSASQAFLVTHLPQLTGPTVAEMLNGRPDDPAARQRLAILQLVPSVPLPDIYDAILDPADALELLLRVISIGDVKQIGALLTAVPRVSPNRDDALRALRALAIDRPEQAPAVDRLAEIIRAHA